MKYAVRTGIFFVAVSFGATLAFMLMIWQVLSPVVTATSIGWDQDPPLCIGAEYIHEYEYDSRDTGPVLVVSDWVDSEFSSIAGEATWHNVTQGTDLSLYAEVNVPEIQPGVYSFISSITAGSGVHRPYIMERVVEVTHCAS